MITSKYLNHEQDYNACKIWHKGSIMLSLDTWEFQ